MRHGTAISGFLMHAKILVKTHHAMPAIASLEINRLVRGNGVEPRSHFASRLILIALEMHLQKRLLKGVFRHLGIAQITPQVGEELACILGYKLLE